MKKIVLLLLISVLASCEKKTQSQETAQFAIPQTGYTSFGEKISTENVRPAFEVSELIGESDSLQVKLTGEIANTCKMKGCWMTVKTGDNSTLRVSFKDYGFFVPKEGMSGKTAVFEGVLTKNVTSVETLRHFAQDEGKSSEEIEAIIEPKAEFAFVANGVLIEE